MNAPIARLARKVFFSSAHRYYNPKLSEAENQRIFGRCYTPHGHGHNYALEAYFEGPVDDDTGMIMNLRDIDEILKSVTDVLDHQHLNFDIPEFKETIPTTENIARYLFEKVHKALPSTSVRLYKVRLFETENLWVDYGYEDTAN